VAKEVYIYGSQARQRIDAAVKAVEGQSLTGHPQDRPNRPTAPRSGEPFWCVVRNVPGDNALWVWVEAAIPSGDYANPDSDGYGTFTGLGPPASPRAQKTGEPDGDYQNYLRGWAKMAVWPGCLAGPYYRLSEWPPTELTNATDVLEARRIGRKWHVKPAIERIPRFRLDPTTPVGDCGNDLRDEG